MGRKQKIVFWICTLLKCVHSVMEFQCQWMYILYLPRPVCGMLLSLYTMVKNGWHYKVSHLIGFMLCLVAFMEEATVRWGAILQLPAYLLSFVSKAPCWHKKNTYLSTFDLFNKLIPVVHNAKILLTSFMVTSLNGKKTDFLSSFANINIPLLPTHDFTNT